MPLYQYKCPKCGYTFERMKSVGNRKKGMCPRCMARADLMLPTGQGLQFKGKGWGVVNDKKDKKEDK